MYLTTLFWNCLHIPYPDRADRVNFATRRKGTTLYLYFEDSDGLKDWKTNLNFPAKAYRRMGKTVWYAHRGFLQAWRAAEPSLAPKIADPSVRKMITVGYSHGAALATLCHEYVWYHRPELRHRIESYGFGSPRVLWGKPDQELSRRWERFFVIRNINDLITHLPPSCFGFSHVGTLIEIGKKGKYNPIAAHRPENILKELFLYEQEAVPPK